MFDVHLSDGDDMAKRVATRVRRFCTECFLNRSHAILLQHESCFESLTRIINTNRYVQTSQETCTLLI